MKTKAVRLYGKNDLRLEEFDLPQIGKDEILAHVVSDSICMSSHKALLTGTDHKRVPKDIDKNPIIIGHEFCGEIVEVGPRWEKTFKPGQKFSIQPALAMKENPFAAPGYSFPYMGGAATYIVIPSAVMELGCLLDYDGDAYFHGSLSEPMSCIVGAYHASYHTGMGSYTHQMGIVEGGNLALLAGAGPMGMGAIDYALHCQRKPKLIVVTDIDDGRLARAKTIYTEAEAARNGIRLIYVNTAKTASPDKELMALVAGEGFNDVLVFAPVRSVIELADRILAPDGCLNFFAGPTNPGFLAELNFYNVHYNSTHIVGTSGGNTDDLKESLRLMEQGIIDPSAMVTHVGGLNCVARAVGNLPDIPGGKKLIYTNIDMDLTAIGEFRELGKKDPLFENLSNIIDGNNGLWCLEAEKYLLSHARSI